MKQVSATTQNITYDEILSTSTPISSDESDTLIQNVYDTTAYLLVLFPLYVFAVVFNSISIYTILTANVYRQYLSNVLLAVICIGALFDIDGQIFLMLTKWANSALESQICVSSFYIRDVGSILIHTHALLLAFERILANLKKHPPNLNINLIQRAHLFLIVSSLISILLSLTVPIYVFTHSLYSSLCGSYDSAPPKLYFSWVYYGFGHSCLWSSAILLGLYFSRKTTISYTTLNPMNRIIFIIIIFSCLNLLIRTIFDDDFGIGDNQSKKTDTKSITMIFIRNLRDLISVLHKICIGLVFFLFRPEIRLWLFESFQRFKLNTRTNVTPQVLKVQNENDDNFNETDDGNLNFRSDI